MLSPVYLTIHKCIHHKLLKKRKKSHIQHVVEDIELDDRLASHNVVDHRHVHEGGDEAGHHEDHSLQQVTCLGCVKSMRSTGGEQKQKI